MAKSYCPLCKEQRTLVGSHIVPEFMYEPVYLDGKAKAVAGKYEVQASTTEKKVFDLTEGFKERLLCADCDNRRLGSIETRAKEVIENIRATKFTDNHEFLKVEYRNFKLFQLSMLWRASISSNWMFTNIILGSKHEEKIRTMLLNEDPGDFCQYGCVIRVTTELTLMRSMYHAQASKFQGHHRYTLITPGIHFEYYVSSHMKSIIFKSLFLQNNGVLPLLKTNREYDESHLLNLVKLVRNVNDIENTMRK